MNKSIFIIFIVVSLFSTITAQDAVMKIELDVDDETTLVSDFYTSHVTEDAPAVMLMHMVGGNRGSWDPLIPALIDAGYHVLNVDLRGHGESDGTRAWDKTEADTLAWLEWLKEQPNVNGVMMVGASVGANLSLIGCASEESCLTVVALSPGLDYRGIMPKQSIVDELADRSALLIAAYEDDWSYEALIDIIPAATGELGVRLYAGGLHGVRMFNGPDRDRLITLIVQWLNEHVTVE